jgi:hypothetical protein
MYLLTFLGCKRSLRDVTTSMNLIPVQQNKRKWVEVLTAVVMKISVFWDITPCSPLKPNWHFGGTCRHQPQGRRISQATCFTLVSYLAYSLTLKMEATCSSETLVDFQRTSQHYIPEDRTLFLQAGDVKIGFADWCYQEPLMTNPVSLGQSNRGI